MKSPRDSSAGRWNPGGSEVAGARASFPRDRADSSDSRKVLCLAKRRTEGGPDCVRKKQEQSPHVL